MSKVFHFLCRVFPICSWTSFSRGLNESSTSVAFINWGLEIYVLCSFYFGLWSILSFLSKFSHCMRTLFFSGHTWLELKLNITPLTHRISLLLPYLLLFTPESQSLYLSFPLTNYTLGKSKQLTEITVPSENGRVSLTLRWKFTTNLLCHLSRWNSKESSTESPPPISWIPTPKLDNLWRSQKKSRNVRFQINLHLSRVFLDRSWSSFS